ncbi:MAG: histidine kinase [Coriobacteriia bacterium]|nr:histidine kinase [Coriobacteriia bacterium]
MKNFFVMAPGDTVRTSELEMMSAPAVDAPVVTMQHTARIAVYDAPAAAPRTEEVTGSCEVDFIEQIASRVFAYARDAGGDIPYTVIREVAENFIHADFCEPIVSILDSGRTIRFADQGPGILNKHKAVLPGFTTARGSMKSVIRGVGSGLPIVNDYLGFSGGSLDIDDNLGYGTVVTIRSSREPALAPTETPTSAPLTQRTQEHALASPPVFPSLTSRQMQVLSLVLELGEVGPTIVSNELSVALSTAYRDLAFLEHNGLIESNTLGKRVLTAEGSAFLDGLFAQ